MMEPGEREETGLTDAVVLPTALEAADRVVARDVDGHLVPLPPLIRDTLGPTDEDREHLSRLHNADRPQLARAWVEAISKPGVVVTAHGWIRSANDNWTYRRFDYCDLRHDPRIGAVLVGVSLLAPDAVAPHHQGVGSPHEPARWSILRLSQFGQIQRAEGTLVDLYGRDESELVGTNGLDLIHPDDHERLLDAWADVVDHDSPGRALRQRVLHTDGTSTWVLASIGRPDRDGSVTIHDLDISAQLAAEDALRSSEERFRNLASGLPISVFVADRNGWFEFTNETCRSLVGDCNTVDEFLGEDDVSWSSMVETAERDGSTEFTVAAEGRILRIRCQRPLPDGTVSGVVEDVTTSTRWREEAASDALTGLASRSAVTRELDRRIDARCRSTVAFIDLDGFKRVNDEHGHDEGDRVLVRVGAALRGMIRDGDIAGRWGGDEFVLVLGDLPPDAQSDLRGRVDAAMITCGAGGASVGFTSLRDDDDVRLVIGRADQAMYSDKRRTRR